MLNAHILTYLLWCRKLVITKKMHTCRAKAKPEDLESIFQNCPKDETNASYWILVPFHYNEEYSLYSFDMKQRIITVMDPGAKKK